MNTPALYDHQEATAEFIRINPRVLCTSDPGTGKSRATLEGYRRRCEGRMLVVAPLSILEPSWGQDINKFLPGFSYAIAHGTPKKRVEAFTHSGADIVITNHDAVKWLLKTPEILEGFTDIVIDEVTAFKNHTSQRSKALGKLIKGFKYRIMLSGTLGSQSILDYWHPVYMLDGGKRLGNKFWGFRASVCEPQQVGPDPRMVQWLDKPEALDAVTDLIKDITIRYKFEDCIDIPEHIKTFTTLEPPAWLMKKYLEFKEFSVLETENGEELSAIHAGAKVKKLLQLLSGAVYDQEGKALKVHDARYNLVLDLIEERDQCVVAYNWKHELEQLTRIASNRNIKYACINGEVKNSDRTKHVKAFQKGELKVIFAHPQSAGHGLTLTAGTTTIWCSPTYNAEHYEQFNRRIYRAGQTRKTETIRIAYADTEEIGVYEKLDTKLERLEELLTLFHTMTKIRKNT